MNGPPDEPAGPSSQGRGPRDTRNLVPRRPGHTPPPSASRARPAPSEARAGTASTQLFRCDEWDGASELQMLVLTAAVCSFISL